MESDFYVGLHKIFYAKMKRMLFIILGVILCVPLYAQSAEGRYASRMTQDGTIFFVMPHKLKQVRDIKKFEYDMTLLNWTDSITVNFTFESDRMELPADLKIESCGVSYKCDSYSLLYIDIKKKHYEVRVTSKFPASVIQSMIKCDTPPIFSFSQLGIYEYATYGESAWKKDKKKLNDIYNLYLYSK